jgi:hypothetical protein
MRLDLATENRRTTFAIRSSFTGKGVHADVSASARTASVIRIEAKRGPERDGRQNREV